MKKKHLHTEEPRNEHKGCSFKLLPLLFVMSQKRHYVGKIERKAFQKVFEMPQSGIREGNMNKSLVADRLSLGVCYYPEHWDKTLWREDLLRMLENGIETVRIAEFAWSKFELTEGVFTYDFFDEFLEIAKDTGMKVIFGTPTAAPPAWLTNKYPEVLNAAMDGVLYRHGARRHYNYNSGVYQELAKRVVEKIAGHYGSHPSIIGWQIDNELNCEKNEFYSESDTLAFREFLKKKYQTLEALNQAWGTIFWNQTYTAWEEVYVPRTTLSNATNPHEVLDYIRFISDSACRFARLQSDIIKKYIKKGDFITTNGLFSNLDNHRMTDESLDFIMYDSYPNFAYCLGTDPEHSTDLNDRKWSRNLTEVRAVSPVFGIMEQQSGANGWNTAMEAPAPRQGQMTLWTLQSVAHGADYISYFRWRTCTMGTEIYWHGILDYSNRDNRRLREVKGINEKMKLLSGVAGASYEAAFGVLKDYDNIWDAQLDAWHKRVDKVSQAGIFKAAQLTHTPMDYVYIRENTKAKELEKYPVLFYPHAAIMTEQKVKVLEEYVSAGGCLVLGCRTGYKDETGKCVMLKLPGLLQPLAGTDVTEYTFAAPDDGKVYVDWEGTKVWAAVFHDILQPLGANAGTLGTYTSNYYAGCPGLIENSFGKGKVYYFGGAFSEETAKIFLEKLNIANPYKEIIEVPQECEIAVRSKKGRKFLFVLNYGKKPVTIHLKESLINLYEGGKEAGSVEIEPYGTRVYEI